MYTCNLAMGNADRKILCPLASQSSSRPYNGQPGEADFGRTHPLACTTLIGSTDPRHPIGVAFVAQPRRPGYTSGLAELRVGDRAMNLGDGLKLETELLDGKTKLILSPYESSPAASTVQKIINTADKCRVVQQKPCKTHVSENMNSSVVCLTQDQLQQLLMSVSQGSGSVSLAENGKEEKASQDSFQLISAPSQPKGVNATGSLQKTEAVSPVSDEGKCVLGRAQEALQQCEQKMAISTSLGAEPVLVEIADSGSGRWLNPDPPVSWDWVGSRDWICSWLLLLEAGLLEYPCSSARQEQQRKWAADLSKRVDSQPRKTGEMICSELSCQRTHQPLESCCVSPDTQELADVHSVYTPSLAIQLEPSEEQRAKPVTDMNVSYSQKTNFLRSMTALLDPAQIEEREKRRHKQLEHQKAIMAQVEENRRKKQQEEEQRKKEEQEEEQRLAREREEMQRQYEEDILKQKQKEVGTCIVDEIMTLKTNQLFHTMQRAQELAQRLKQEQRIRELTQKGHDTSRLIKNLGAIVDYKVSATISSSGGDAETAEGTRAATPSTNSPRTDIGVQTDDLNLGIFNNELQHCGSLTERGTRNFSSPEISTEFNGHTSTKKDKQELSIAKGTNLDKETTWHNGQCNQYRRTEKQTKHSMKKCPKKPAWNINKPLKRYVPASARYPIHLQKEKEEKKLRRQMELLHLLERNNPENLSQNKGPSPQVLSPSHRETESENRLQLIKKAEEPLKTSDIKEWFQLSAIKSRTQQTQTDSVHSPLKNSDYEKKNLALGDGQTQLSEEMSETTHFIPYVRTNEIYYLDPDAPLSRPSTQENQYQKSHDCDQQQELFNSDHIRDPLLNPKLVKNRDRQQAILKGLSELRQAHPFGIFPKLSLIPSEELGGEELTFSFSLAYGGQTSVPAGSRDT
ncbi:Coiled-coil domain-containing protein 66 [Microtus ochrogaster]|uniref:Coiled-coil domain-containing protein 66 n=1 Tax=Microtus ochrogaster TaxID=79684 RepID=A0A8J6GQ18_MICOH|nr:Coiled-coil domain-containing protein 66 [Microtus ochrogaster]